MNEKKGLYHSLSMQAQALVAGESDLIANMANISALLFTLLPEVNWAGFYLYKQDQLVLGPFQGKPACIRIPMGKGVCGTAASTLNTQVVEDVHQFDGHIACDAASNSEIVVPLVIGDALVGVLDVDSPVRSRFDNDDKEGLETIVGILVKSQQ